MRHLFAALLVLAFPLWADAAQARQYAVLSLVGDKLLVVQREMSTGSRLDTNTRTFVALPDRSIDRTVTLAVDEALRKANPGSSPILLGVRDPRLFEASSQWAGSTDGAARVYEAVKPVLASTQATHLVLVTKHRHRAMLRLRDGHVGSGYLEGVGFYVDQGSMARSMATVTEAERGFIAPFSYLRIALIEVASGKVLAEEYVVGSQAVQAPEASSIGDAWSALSESEKAERLARVIREETARAMPMVLAQR